MIKHSGLTNSLWISNPVHIGSLFESYHQKLLPEIKALQGSNDNYDVKLLTSIMGISENTTNFLELIDYCGEEKFDVPEEPSSLNQHRVSTRHRLFDRFSLPPSEVCGLATLENIRTITKEKTYFRGLKYTNSIFISNEEKGKSDLEVKKDIVISVKIHDTVTPNDRNPALMKCYSQEFLVLGSQTLVELRDNIVCPSDLFTSFRDGEGLVHDNEISCLRAKDVFKSGFFFIEDTFYNDFRDPKNIDYSEVIMKWAEFKKMGPLNTSSMSGIKFEDLTVRFGYPYVYQHQGNCEHLLVFTDASLLHEDDICEASQYPVLKSIGGKKVQDCMICYYYCARWITFGNERVPVDPCYFCDECFKSYNYINGKKIGSFRVYKYNPFLPLILD